MKWLPSHSPDAVRIHLKWIRYSLIGHNRRSLRHILDSSNSAAVNLYNAVKYDTAMIDMTLTIGNWIMNSSRFSPNDRNVLRKSFLPFVSWKGLLSIATLLTNICVEFGALFVENLSITKFRNALSALSHLLDLINRPIQATTIARLPSRSQETRLQKASEASRVGRFADGRSISPLFAAFKSPGGVANPFTFDGTAVLSLSVPELDQLRDLANDLTCMDPMNRWEVLENGQNLGM
jgi:hypothetical protein